MRRLNFSGFFCEPNLQNLRHEPVLFPRRDVLLDLEGFLVVHLGEGSDERHLLMVRETDTPAVDVLVGAASVSPLNDKDAI